MWDNMSGFWRMQCAGDSFDITAKVSLENPNSIQRLSFKYIKNVLALFTLPGPCRERKGVEDIMGEIHFCLTILERKRENYFDYKTWMPIGTRTKYNSDHLGHIGEASKKKTGFFQKNSERGGGGSRRIQNFLIRKN